MVSKEGKTDLGAVKIHNEVISAIASQAAMEVEGVMGLKGGILSQGVLRFLKGRQNVKQIADMLSKRNLSSGVKVETGEDKVKIDISVIVKYGVNIPQVAIQIQENIKSTIEKMTGLSTAEVNVNVQGISGKGERGVGHENV